MTRTFIIYNSILVFTVMFSVLVEKSHRRTNEYLWRTLLFLSQAIPACIRKGIGTDYRGYVGLFRMYGYSTDNHEWGFKTLAQILHFCHLDAQWFIAILSSIPLFIVAYCVPKKRFRYFSIIYFFCCYIDIIGTSRQEVAVAIMMLGVLSLYKKRGTIKYLIAAGGAYLFHHSSILYIPMLLLKKVKLSAKGAYVFFGIMVFFVVGGDVSRWILTNSMFLNSRFAIYLATDYISEGHVGTGLGVLANIFLPLLFLLFYNRTTRYMRHSAFFGWLTIIFVACYLLSTQIHIFGRLIDCVRFVPAFIAFPTCKAIFKRRPSLALLGFILVYTIVFEKVIYESQSYLGSGLGVSPYECIFD